MLRADGVSLFPRVISCEEGKALAESWNAAFMESSAKENQVPCLHLSPIGWLPSACGIDAKGTDSFGTEESCAKTWRPFKDKKQLWHHRSLFWH